MTDDFFAKALELERAGKPFVTATVVRVEPPTSGKPGDKAIITLDGQVFGWIGGSCTRPVVEEEARAVLEEDRSRLVRLAADSDEAARREGLTDLSMTCYSGGTMEIYVEPHPPKLRLLIVGEQPIARSLARLGQAMGYQILAVRSPGEGAGLPEAEEHLERPEALAEHIHPLTYVVVATHGDHDEVALEPALRAGAPWVGLVASRKRAASIRDFLAGRGLSEDELAVLSVPAGLDIGARQPEEIALSILAEIVQHRHSREKIDWTSEGMGEAHATELESPVALETAIDPICGMTVQIAGARHIHEHQGTLYYFCCGGCKSRFAADPEGALAARTPTA